MISRESEVLGYLVPPWRYIENDLGKVSSVPCLAAEYAHFCS